MDAVIKNNPGNCIWFCLGNVKLWVVMALIFVALLLVNSSATDGSKLWFLDPFRTLSFLIVVVINDRCRMRKRLRLNSGRTTALLMAISWLSGMVFELSLSGSLIIL